MMWIRLIWSFQYDEEKEKKAEKERKKAQLKALEDRWKVGKRGRVDSMLTCWTGGPRSSLTAAQVSSPLLPAICCLHGDAQKASLLYTHLYSVHPYW